MTTWFPPTPEELQRQRESVALWHWNDDLHENGLIWREVMAQVKKELWDKEPWMRQCPELFR